MIEYGQEIGKGGDGLWHVRVAGNYKGRACETELEARALARMVAAGRRIILTVFVVEGPSMPKPAPRRRAPRVPRKPPESKPTDDE